MSNDDRSRWSDPIGPFRADQIHDGDRYELSDGHPIRGMPHGACHSRAILVGGAFLRSDPAVTSVGADTGIAFNHDKNLRAPDLVVNVDLDVAGWIREAPPLAVEYVSVGQDRDELARKIAELLEFGTRILWVVHLVGPLRVDVHEPNLPVRTVPGDGVLTAPGILQNPVPVRALVDRDAAHEATLRNLLACHGYASLDAVREDAREQQLATVRARLHAQLQTRGWTLAPSLTDRITACSDLDRLLGWLTAAVVADSAEAALR
jgi:hypothetical protein